MTHEHALTGPIRSEYTVGHTTVLELRGDLDIAVTPIVTARLDALTACPHPDLVVDLRPVPFLTAPRWEYCAGHARGSVSGTAGCVSSPAATAYATSCAAPDWRAPSMSTDR